MRPEAARAHRRGENDRELREVERLVFRFTFALALALIAAFAFGYIVGVSRHETLEP